MKAIEPSLKISKSLLNSDQSKVDAFWLVPQDTGEPRKLKLWASDSDPLIEKPYEFQAIFCTSRRCSCDRVAFTTWIEARRSGGALKQLYFTVGFGGSSSEVVDLSFPAEFPKKLMKTVEILFASERKYLRSLRRQYRLIKDAVSIGHQCAGPSKILRESARSKDSSY